MKKLMRFVVSGALFGAALATVLAPRGIAWYFEPPVEMGINCRPAAEWAMNRLEWSQAIGAMLGAAIGVFLTYVFRQKKRFEPTLGSGKLDSSEIPPDPRM